MGTTGVGVLATGSAALAQAPPATGLPSAQFGPAKAATYNSVPVLAEDSLTNGGLPYATAAPYPANSWADVPGGTAAVALTPPSNWINTLLLRSIDRAGNRSPAAEYEVLIL